RRQSLKPRPWPRRRCPATPPAPVARSSSSSAAAGKTPHPSSMPRPPEPAPAPILTPSLRPTTPAPSTPAAAAQEPQVARPRHRDLGKRGSSVLIRIHGERELVDLARVEAGQAQIEVHRLQLHELRA